MKRRKTIAALVCVGMVLGTQSAVTPNSWASSTVKLRVVVEHVQQQGCTDNGSGSDFFSTIAIEGQEFKFGEITDEDSISPNWTAEKEFDVDQTSEAWVVIKLYDEDDGLNFDDDVCDISSADGTELDLHVTLLPCHVAGEAPGSCVTAITSGGSQDGDGNADLRFRVEVDVPAATDGLAVRCTHSPLWPKAGDDVTITIEALDGSVQVGDTVEDFSDGSPAPPLVDHKKIADTLQIWVGDQAAADLDVSIKSSTTFVVEDIPGGNLVYGCLAKADGETVFTGWRRTGLGAETESPGIPVIYTGARVNSVDVVFIPDEDSYKGADDPDFQDDVANVIKGAYYGQDWFLANQNRFNFWLADDTGDADRVSAPTREDPGATECVLTTPKNWFMYAWRDVGAILHTDNFRDCATGDSVFSAEPGSLGTVLHETGHAPFGLADEYCCDGGYFENPPFPNLWDSRGECQTDAPDLGRTPADCRTITDSRPNPAQNWSLSEPDNTDLMNSDRRPPQAADIRRMDWFIANCVAGKC
ncbi:hypothetical protein ACQP00_24700 [Dactylosporangium sp. CS-047395]|uniref:hypothetical protein n=1 Tax=Dactylosporangium sp. CS-047395 TaxID=3239936 RepID=UPI003D924694